MERDSSEVSGDDRKPSASYSMVQTPLLGLTTDESLPVFVPFRFTPMWIQGNTKLQNNNNGQCKDPATDASNRILTDKDRHLSSRAYNPTPYNKTKQPFTAVTIQKSASTNALATEMSIKRRKVAKEAINTSCKFKTATPYRRPYFAESKDLEESRVAQESVASVVKRNVWSPPAVADKRLAPSVATEKQLSSNAVTEHHKFSTPVNGNQFSGEMHAKKLYSSAEFGNLLDSAGTENHLPSDGVFVNQFPKTRIKRIVATWPNINRRKEESPPIVTESLTKHVSPRFPVPFPRKRSAISEVSPKRLEPEIHETAYSPVKVESDQKLELPPDVVAKSTYPQTELRPKTGNVTDQIEKYYKHILFLVETIMKGQEHEKTNVSGDQKEAIVVKERETENERCHIENSTYDIQKVDFDKKAQRMVKYERHKEPNASSGEKWAYVVKARETEKESGCVDNAQEMKCCDEILFQERNEANGCLVQRKFKLVKSFTDASSVALVWLFRFVKRYLFLTFILIRIFH